MSSLPLLRVLFEKTLRELEHFRRVVVRRGGQFQQGLNQLRSSCTVLRRFSRSSGRRGSV